LVVLRLSSRHFPHHVSQVNSFSAGLDVVLRQFAVPGGSGGTLVLLHCTSARNIEDLSFFPERERLLLPNVKYRVDQAVASHHAPRVARDFKLLEKGRLDGTALAQFPPNLDLVVITETQ
jgi:hypothetical protein